MSKRHGWIGVKSSISHNETSFGNMPNPLPAVVVVVGCCHRCHSEQTTCWRENLYFITLWVVKLVEAVCSLQNVATGGGTWRMHFGCPGSDQPLFFVYVYIYALFSMYICMFAPYVYIYVCVRCVNWDSLSLSKCPSLVTVKQQIQMLQCYNSCVFAERFSCPQPPLAHMHPNISDMCP